MMMKKDSYDFLIKVLNDACLSGAASILEEISPEQSSGATEKGKLDEQSSPKMEKAKSKKNLETLTIGTEGLKIIRFRMLKFFFVNYFLKIFLCFKRL